MTWSISASGLKDEVLQKIDEATATSIGPKETKAFDAAKELCKAQVECLGTAGASVSASGHTGGCSISISGV